MAGVIVPKLPDPSDTRGTLAALARLEIEAAIRDGGVAMRLAFDAQTVPEVAEIIGSGPGANFDGLAEYLSARQEAGDLRADMDPRLMAEAFFNLTSTMVMARHLLGHVGPAEELGADETIEQLVELYWRGVRSEG